MVISVYKIRYLVARSYVEHMVVRMHKTDIYDTFAKGTYWKCVFTRKEVYCFSDLWAENGPLLGPIDLDI